MTDAIGGYFGMEELSGKFNSFIHDGGVLLNLGRNAFQYILQSIPNEIDKLYIPYYTCSVVWEHLFFSGKIWFYRIDRNLEIVEDIKLGEHDYIVVNNYFGIKDQYIAQLSKKYGNHLIVDNAQAFFAPVIQDAYAFYSPRKFFGVPDGGVAYVANNAKPVWCEEQDDSSDRLRHLQLRKEKGAEAGFATYQLNENKLDSLPMKLMSNYTHEVLQGIDYAEVVEKRRTNYKMLHEALGAMNELPLPEIDSFVCPMVYPFIPKSGNTNLRKQLQEQRIYTATYWPILAKMNHDTLEERLAMKIIALPIDQRYNEEDMKRIIDIVRGLLANEQIGGNLQVLRGGVKIRPLRIEDAKTSYKWRNDKEVFYYTGNTYDNFISYKTELEWIKRVINNSNEFRCAIEVDGKYVGNIYLTDIDEESAEYQIFIGEKDYWGRGVAAEASRQILKYAFEKRGLKCVYLHVREDNERALRLYKKMGFIPCNSDNHWIKMIIQYRQ